MAKTVATSKGSFSGILDALARAEQTQKQIADYTKELAVASGQYGMLPASQPMDTTLSQLGGLTTVKPGQAWRYVRPAPEGQAGTGGGGIPSGPILIYGTQTPVHESFFPMIQSGLEQNQFANSKLDNSTVMPPLSMTNEWLALILAIIDQESKFGQLPIKDIYAPAGAYPAPGKWLPNRGGYVGPMQMATRGKGNIIYGNVYDTQTNIHGGIHHLWWFGNCNFANARSNRGTDGQMFGWINKLAWTIQSYNAGPGNTNQNYYAKVWERNYPWYLQQLQRVGTSGGATPGALTPSGGPAPANAMAMFDWQLGATPHSLSGGGHSVIKRQGRAVDLGAAGGTGIPAFEDGTVTMVRHHSVDYYGWWIVVKGSRLIYYGHMVPSVKEGDRVRAGQIIGTLKKLRNWDHLHLEIYRGDGSNLLTSNAPKAVLDAFRAEMSGAGLGGAPSSAGTGVPSSLGGTTQPPGIYDTIRFTESLQGSGERRWP